MMGMPNNNAAGGAGVHERPRQDDRNDRLPGLKLYDCIQRPFFKQTWMKLFVQTIGDKSQDGYSMRAVYDGTHMGGHEWTLNNNALPAAPAQPVAGVQYQHVLTAAQRTKSKKPVQMNEGEVKQVCIKCGGIGHRATFKLKSGSLSYCRTFNVLPDYVAKGMRYPHLEGNPSLQQIREKVFKAGAKANASLDEVCAIDVSKIFKIAEINDGASSSADDGSLDEIKKLMGLAVIENEDSSDDEDESKNGDEDE